MPMIPAVCDNCSNIFSSGIFIENATATFDNTRSGPCPYCGGMGHVPNGTFRVVRDAIELLVSPERTVEELKRFKNVLQDVKKSNLKPEKVATRLEKETPEFSSILAFLKNEDFRYWLPVVLTILNILIALSLSNKTEEPKIEVNQVINQFYEQPVIAKPVEKRSVNKEKLSTNIKQEPIKVNKIGRNVSCPCGSGVKYKYCHGIN